MNGLEERTEECLRRVKGSGLAELESVNRLGRAPSMPIAVPTRCLKTSGWSRRQEFLLEKSKTAQSRYDRDDRQLQIWSRDLSGLRQLQTPQGSI